MLATELCSKPLPKVQEPSAPHKRNQQAAFARRYVCTATAASVPQHRIDHRQRALPNYFPGTYAAKHKAPCADTAATLFRRPARVTKQTRGRRPGATPAAGRSRAQAPARSAGPGGAAGGAAAPPPGSAAGPAKPPAPRGRGQARGARGQRGPGARGRRGAGGPARRRQPPSATEKGGESTAG